MTTATAEKSKAIKIDPATVTIERAPPIEHKGREPYYVKGRKIIKVAGEPYGIINEHQHGGRGNSYTFQQIGGQTIMRKTSEATKYHAARFRDVTVYGDKMEARGKGPSVTVLPVAERLHAMAVELIEAGHLVSAAAQNARVEENRRVMREAEERRKTEKIDNFAARAEMAIDAAIPGALPTVARAPLIAQIIKAMEWAQSQ